MVPTPTFIMHISRTTTWDLQRDFRMNFPVTDLGFAGFGASARADLTGHAAFGRCEIRHSGSLQGCHGLPRALPAGFLLWGGDGEHSDRWIQTVG